MHSARSNGMSEGLGDGLDDDEVARIARGNANAPRSPGALRVRRPKSKRHLGVSERGSKAILLRQRDTMLLDDDGVRRSVGDDGQLFLEANHVDGFEDGVRRIVLDAERRTYALHGTELVLNTVGPEPTEDGPPRPGNDEQS